MRQHLHQIFMIVALPTILSVALLAFLLRDSLHDWAVERWASDKYGFVETLAHDIDADIKHAAELLGVAAASEAFKALTEREQIDLSINGLPEHLDSGKRRLMEHLRSKGGFSAVFVLTPKGDHYMSHPFPIQLQLKKYNLSDRPYFQQAKETRKLSISDSFTGADGVPAIAIDLPVLDAQGEIVMHLGGVLYLKHLSDFLAKHKIKPFDLAVLMDRRDQLIAASNANRLAQPPEEPLLSYSSSANNVVKADTPEFSVYKTHAVHFSDGSGHRWFAYDATLSSGWQLLLFHSGAALNSIIAPQVRQITIFAAAIVLLPGLIGLWVANRFRRKWLDASQHLLKSHATLEHRVAERTAELQRSETRHRTLFETSADGIMILEGDRFIDCNLTAIKLFGASSREHLIDLHPWDLSPPCQPERRNSKTEAEIAIGKALADGFHEVEWVHRRLDNQNDFVARVLLSRMKIDERVLIQTSIRDITESKEHQKQLEYFAHFDALTCLPNRVLLADRLQMAMAQVQRRQKLLAVVYLDLDGFKLINDRNSHEIGDQVLITMSKRMKEIIREGDTLARIGGDEFVAVLTDLDDETSCAPILNRLLAASALPVLAGDLRLRISASLGVTYYPQANDINADQLMRQADQAMYQAKVAGKNRYHVFDTAQDSDIRIHHESLEHIRHAFAQREFVLHYQPKVNMRSGQLIGAEALIRWQHPKKGLLPPSAFLPVIENHPLAVDVGEWVIDSALTQIELWRAEGLDLPVSVNLGAEQLQQPDFVQRLEVILANHPQTNPASLELEVLETSALADMDQVAQMIEDSAKLGVKFALDDFGTGYSSLTYLKRLHVALIKIDQSFVRHMLDDADDLAILQGVIGLAAAFNRQVIAEGVETAAHGTALLQLGCELAQGYGIARPMPPGQLPDWAANWQPDKAWTKE